MSSYFHLPKNSEIEKVLAGQLLTGGAKPNFDTVPNYENLSNRPTDILLLNGNGDNAVPGRAGLTIVPDTTNCMSWGADHNGQHLLIDDTTSDDYAYIPTPFSGADSSYSSFTVFVDVTLDSATTSAKSILALATSPTSTTGSFTIRAFNSKIHYNKGTDDISTSWNIEAGKRYRIVLRCVNFIPLTYTVYMYINGEYIGNKTNNVFTDFTADNLYVGCGEQTSMEEHPGRYYSAGAILSPGQNNPTISEAEAIHISRYGIYDWGLVSTESKAQKLIEFGADSYPSPFDSYWLPAQSEIARALRGMGSAPGKKPTGNPKLRTDNPIAQKLSLLVDFRDHWVDASTGVNVRDVKHRTLFEEVGISSAEILHNQNGPLLDLSGTYLEAEATDSPGTVLEGSFSIAIKFKADNNTSNYRVLGKHANGGDGYLAYIDTNGSLIPYVNGSAKGSLAATTAGVWNTASWTFNGTDRIYLTNGSVTTTADTSQVIDQSLFKFFIGAYNWSGFANFPGQFEYVALFNEPLTEAEMLAFEADPWYWVYEPANQEPKLLSSVTPEVIDDSGEVLPRYWIPAESEITKTIRGERIGLYQIPFQDKHISSFTPSSTLFAALVSSDINYGRFKELNKNLFFEAIDEPNLSSNEIILDRDNVGNLGAYFSYNGNNRWQLNNVLSDFTTQHISIIARVYLDNSATASGTTLVRLGGTTGGDNVGLTVDPSASTIAFIFTGNSYQECTASITVDTGRWITVAGRMRPGGTASDMQIWVDGKAVSPTIDNTDNPTYINVEASKITIGPTSNFRGQFSVAYIFYFNEWMPEGALISYGNYPSQLFSKQEQSNYGLLQATVQEDSSGTRKFYPLIAETDITKALTGTTAKPFVSPNYPVNPASFVSQDAALYVPANKFKNATQGYLVGDINVDDANATPEGSYIRIEPDPDHGQLSYKVTGTRNFYDDLSNEGFWHNGNDPQCFAVSFNNSPSDSATTIFKTAGSAANLGCIRLGGGLDIEVGRVVDGAGTNALVQTTTNFANDGDHIVVVGKANGGTLKVWFHNITTGERVYATDTYSGSTVFTNSPGALGDSGAHTTYMHGMLVDKGTEWSDALCSDIAYNNFWQIVEPVSSVASPIIPFVDSLNYIPHLPNSEVAKVLKGQLPSPNERRNYNLKVKPEWIAKGLSAAWVFGPGGARELAFGREVFAEGDIIYGPDYVETKGAVDSWLRLNVFDAAKNPPMAFVIDAEDLGGDISKKSFSYLENNLTSISGILCEFESIAVFENNAIDGVINNMTPNPANNNCIATSWEGSSRLAGSLKGSDVTVDFSAGAWTTSNRTFVNLGGSLTYASNDLTSNQNSGDASQARIRLFLAFDADVSNIDLKRLSYDPWIVFESNYNSVTTVQIDETPTEKTRIPADTEVGKAYRGAIIEPGTIPRFPVKINPNYPLISRLNGAFQWSQGAWRDYLDKYPVLSSYWNLLPPTASLTRDGLEIDAAGDYIFLYNYGDTLVATGSWTIAFKYKYNGIADASTGRWLSNGENQALLYHLGTSIYVSGGNTYDASDSFDDGNWHTFVMCCDGYASSGSGTTRLYYDGELVISTTAATNAEVDLTGARASIVLGNRTTGNRNKNGWYDNHLFFDRALSDAEARYVANNLESVWISADDSTVLVDEDIKFDKYSLPADSDLSKVLKGDS